MPTSARPGSTTCSRSRDRTLRSSRAARSCSSYLIGLSRFVGQIAALAAIGGYVLAVGWQPSVVRAGVAGALASLAWLASRPSDRWYFLLLGAALLARLEPVLAARRRIPALVRGRRRRSSSSSRGSSRRSPGTRCRTRSPRSSRSPAACGIATAPILLTQFGVVPLYSIPANALAAPVVAPLLGIALVTAIVAPVAPPLAAVLAWVNGWLAAYLAAVRADGRRAAVCGRFRSCCGRDRRGRPLRRLSRHSARPPERAGVRDDRPRCGSHRGRLASPRIVGAAASDRPAHHVPGRRPGRRSADPGPRRRGPRRRRAA